MTQNLSQIERRTSAYWYVDGLVELAVGVIFLVMSLFFLCANLISPGWIAGIAIGIGQPVIILLGFIFSGKLIRSMKEKITYPRSGYVAYKQPVKKKRWQKIVLSALVAILIIVALGLITPNLGEGSIWVIAAIFLALFMVYMGFRSAVLRFYLLAVFVIGAGLLVPILHLSGLLAPTVFYGTVAALLLLSGGITLAIYLNTPPANSGEEA